MNDTAASDFDKDAAWVNDVIWLVHTGQNYYWHDGFYWDAMSADIREFEARRAMNAISWLVACKISQSTNTDVEPEVVFQRLCLQQRLSESELREQLTFLVHLLLAFESE